MKNIKKSIQSCFQDFPWKVSVIITGSYSRKDYLSPENSDIDCLVVIENNAVEFLKTIKYDLKQKLNELKIDNLTFIITLKNSIVDNQTGMYVQSITTESVIVDELQIMGEILQKQADSDHLVTVVQSICYYCSKYNYTKDERSKNKILSLMDFFIEINYKQKITLTEFRVQEHKQTIDIKSIVNFVEKKINNLEILKSSQYFFSNQKNTILSNKNIFYHVRNLVFIENQGLSMNESLVLNNEN